MWLCKCGLQNSGLNNDCAAVKTWKHLEHYQISTNTPDFHTAVVRLREMGINMPEMTESEKLFAKYYNQGKLLVSEMDDTSLREHREQLQQIATEARAKLMAADDEIRERTAKKRVKDKEWLVSVDHSQPTSDAINAVKQRAARMSKLDKMRMQLQNAGIDEETIKEMMANLERKATEKQVKTITFQRPATETAAIQIPVTTTEPESLNGEKKPFDASGIKFYTPSS